MLDAFASLFPSSDMYVLWNDDPDRYPDHRVHESWLANTPLRRYKAASIPFLLPTWRMLRSTEKYDWLLISSHLFAHHARFLGINRDIPKYVYAHTPARYIWTPELDARGSSPIMRAASSALKPIDRKRAQEAYKIAANSNFVKQRIEQTWHRSATVIYPPVDISAITDSSAWQRSLTSAEEMLLQSLEEPFIFGASRFVPYKRLEWVISAGVSLDIPVVLAGRGPELGYLSSVAKQAPVPVHIIESPSDSLLYALYHSAMVFGFPAIEDFGIMPVEAQAAGTPVATTSFGGATESHLEGVTGISAEADDVGAFTQAVERATHLHDKSAIIKEAEQFNQTRFQHEIVHWMSDT